MLQSDTPILDGIRFPEDLRIFPEGRLVQLAEELRQETISAVSVTGGHLGAGLGVVELTIALHYIFDTPYDRLIWDVGHQAYPHKILTGRRDRIRTLRQEKGLSGFTKRAESIYDPFGAGHSSTSLSAGLGMVVAGTLLTEKRNVITVIGDGAMSAGMAYEAMNNAGALGARIIVVLNDNDMSISSPRGAMRAYLARLVSSIAYRELRDRAKAFGKKLPHCFFEKFRRSEEYARGFFTGSGTLFEELGFYYIGPIDGHDFSHLLPVLRNVRDYAEGPVLIHAVTRKGKGYPPAEAASDKYHGVNCFDIVTGKQKNISNIPSYTKIFASALVKEAFYDKKIIAITAAMPEGTGLDLFSKHFPTRIFDVGIAEQHAVTFAAGLAAEGMKPFVAIYSTFLQRCYDQIIHDVSIQNLPVRFAIDRAGIVGADGATHTGSFDICFLTALPDFVVMAPANSRELIHMVRTAAAYDNGPIAFRYPRDGGKEEDLLQRGEILPIGKGRILREGARVAILSFGTCLHNALVAADKLDDLGFSTTVADARFAKPLDKELVTFLVQNHSLLVTVEEGAQNGFAARILHFLSSSGLLDYGIKIRNLTLPDNYLNHGVRDKILSEVGLDHAGILKIVLSVLGARIK